MTSPINRKLRFALLPFALLLGAAPERIPFGGSLPACRKGEFVTVRKGELLCTSLLGGDLVLPQDCAGRVAALSRDGKSWTCIPRAEIDPEKAATVTGMLTEAQAALKVAQKEGNSPPSSTGVFVGTTAVKTTGLIRRAGTEAGILSANAMCSDEYPGSHFCSGYELHHSVVARLITPQKGMARAWVFHPAWKTPVGPAQNAEEGLADTCASYTYGADDRGWSGMAAEFETTRLNATDKVLAFRGGTLTPCSGSLPVACCK